MHTRRHPTIVLVTGALLLLAPAAQAGDHYPPKPTPTVTVTPTPTPTPTPTVTPTPTPTPTPTVPVTTAPPVGPPPAAPAPRPPAPTTLAATGTDPAGWAAATALVLLGVAAVAAARRRGENR